MEQCFGSHPLATRVLGTTESIADLTVEQLREYPCGHYCTDNLTLVASGNVDVDRMIEYTLAATAGWPAATAPRKLSKPLYGCRQQVIHREGTLQHYGIHAWPGMDCNDAQRYALRILCSILADDSGSRLFWELIDTGRAETAAIWPHLFDECGCLLGYLCCAPEDAADNEAIIARVIDQVLQDGVSERELELARNKISSSLILADERPSSRLFAVGQSWLSRRSYEPLDVILSRYAAVTGDDVLQAAQRTLGHPRRCRSSW